MPYMEAYTPSPLPPQAPPEQEAVAVPEAQPMPTVATVPSRVMAVAADKGTVTTPLALPILVWSYIIVAVGTVIAWMLHVVVDPDPPVPVDGLSTFAVLYVAAQGIERVLEPLSDRIQPKAAQSHERNETVATAKAMASDLSVNDTDREAALKAAANAKANLERRLAERTLLFWAIATALGTVLAGVLGLELLRSVGIPSAPDWLEILITGLAVGGGTKPLHDLIKALQAKKNEAEDPT
jgi:hypothetical protein